ncbi:MAG TPA: hypothetical protein VF493_13580 [Terriglobales bacterium]
MKSFKAILGVGTVVIVFLVVAKLFPVYLASYQFQDQINSISRLAAYSFTIKNEDDIRHLVDEQVKDIGIPLRTEDIHVIRQPNVVVIWADYTVHVDFPTHPMDLKFHPAARNGEKIEPSAIPQFQ